MISEATQMGMATLMMVARTTVAVAAVLLAATGITLALFLAA